ncbi:MAG: hypothetical protein E6K80_03370 [Candidatus Eisenbacteria bacterium]|uniref:DUF420 domain-containing protein n=1 Tax=Eiseniibacteriota bacterium TaxID=2212470 RepID=A0A538U8J6_UNCEI|nr:MAG: hypothetical protein E6K80_03370 [Candidatus Eisenbacteria bacterium]
MNIPPLSVFSAVSELFVTAGVLYVVWANWNRRRFSGLIFLLLALFEAMVNVLYMAARAARASAGVETVATGMKVFFAAHGILSLLAYIGFVILGVFAFQEQKVDRWFFRERPYLTVIFLVVWVVSIGSGEVIFAMRYLRS